MPKTGLLPTGLPHVAMLAVVLLAVPWALARAQDLETLGRAEPLKISGSISASLSGYDVEGRPPSREKSSWILRGSPTVTLYGIVLPFSLTVTEQDREFRQPLNKLGVSPTYRWATLHVGFRNLSWSPYSLAGHSMLGAGVELAPRGFQAGWVSGRLRRAIEADSTAGAGTIAPVLRREGSAMRLGWGAKAGGVALVVFHGEDDPGTLPPTGAPPTLLPAENAVVSVIANGRVMDRLTARLEVAQSAFTPDRRSATAGDFDKALLGLLGGAIEKRAGTVEAQAVEASLAWKDGWGGLGMRYRRIDPGFQSMGAYYFHDDVQNVTVEPEFNLAEGKVRVSGSLGFQHDNLDDDQDLQTDRTIGSARLDWSPVPKYTANATFSNYDVDQKAGTSPIDSSGAVVSQTTREMGLTQVLSLPGPHLSHNAVLTWNRQHLDDHSALTGTVDNSYTSTMIGGHYVLSVARLGVSGTVGYSRGRFDLEAGETVTAGPQLGLTKSLFRNRANAGVTASFRTTSLDGDDQVRTKTVQVNATVRPVRKHQVQLRLSIQDNEAKNPAATSSKETRSELGYAYTF